MNKMPSCRPCSQNHAMRCPSRQLAESPFSINKEVYFAVKFTVYAYITTAEKGVLKISIRNKWCRPSMSTQICNNMMWQSTFVKLFTGNWFNACKCSLWPETSFCSSPAHPTHRAHRDPKEKYNILNNRHRPCAILHIRLNKKIVLWFYMRQPIKTKRLPKYILYSKKEQKNSVSSFKKYQVTLCDQSFDCLLV
jgi:hypothetical protein